MLLPSLVVVEGVAGDYDTVMLFGGSGGGNAASTHTVVQWQPGLCDCYLWLLSRKGCLSLRCTRQKNTSIPLLLLLSPDETPHTPNTKHRNGEVRIAIALRVGSASPRSRSATGACTQKQRAREQHPHFSLTPSLVLSQAISLLHTHTTK